MIFWERGGGGQFNYFVRNKQEKSFYLHICLFKDKLSNLNVNQEALR